jgi:hypothetical protein
LFVLSLITGYKFVRGIPPYLIWFDILNINK